MADLAIWNPHRQHRCRFVLVCGRGCVLSSWDGGSGWKARVEGRGKKPLALVDRASTRFEAELFAQDAAESRLRNPGRPRYWTNYASGSRGT